MLAIVSQYERGAVEYQKTVVLGVTGCIAAYKACEIVRLLQKAGVNVKVVMTESATHFVGVATFEALTHDKVEHVFFQEGQDPIPHISLAQQADLFLVAPCTVNVAAKLAHGIADDVLTSAALACRAPLMIAPAANVNMYTNPATQTNLDTLKARGVHVIEADSGYLACGDEGKGRLAEPDAIVSEALRQLGISKGDMTGMKVMITAGPTIEPIDPVRYITNFSSGKTGYSLASAAARRGADVTIISGPVAVDAPTGVKVVRVTTAQEMYEASAEVFPESDIAIFAAAVADMRPADVAPNKLKKGLDADALQAIKLAENPDIIASLAVHKNGQTVVGFAAETQNLIENAHAKLIAKNADLIIANMVGNGLAFGTDGNEIWLVTRNNTEHLQFMMKPELSNIVLDKILEMRACEQDN